MKPIPDEVVARNPERHALFVELNQASNNLRAAILQGDQYEIQGRINDYGERLRDYLSVVQKSRVMRWHD